MNKKFQYTYTAPTEEEKLEIKHIQKQYLQKDERSLKLEHLRKLDNKVKNIPTCVSLIVGIVGLLIFGIGLTCILEWSQIIIGIIVSAISIAPISIAYPLYTKLDRKLRNKYSNEIVSISNELLNDK